MSCNICHGHPDCPCCQSEGTTAPCPTCNGTGYDNYYDATGEEITKERYDTLSPSERMADECVTCDGAGEIAYEYKLDYDYSE